MTTDGWGVPTHRGRGEVAELLGMNVQMVRRYAREGRLPAYKLPGGRTLKFSATRSTSSSGLIPRRPRTRSLMLGRPEDCQDQVGGHHQSSTVDVLDGDVVAGHHLEAPDHQVVAGKGETGPRARR